MILGIPTEIKEHEYRVGATPSGVRELKAEGHRIIVERGAGEGKSTNYSKRGRGCLHFSTLQQIQRLQSLY